ncbi:hypothetical protein ACFC5Z_27535 [Streptomyces sp. NPDC056004]|uniref:hypothetical protein n=1 Tax=Streptomyces sp. NPDC056004 TaxID=3345677 RepID=UPI0035DB6CA1
MQRPAPADDTDLLAQITAECAQLRRQFSLGARTSLRYTTAVAVSAAEHESLP